VSQNIAIRIITTINLLNFNHIEIFMVIIKAEHNVETITGEGFPLRGKIISTLDATLRFRKWIAPSDRVGVNNKLICGKHQLLYDYLKEVEGLKLDNSPSSSMAEYWGTRATPPTKGNRIYVTIARSGFLGNGLGLDISVKIGREVKAYDMLDLRALDNFILTGDYPNRRRDEYTGQWEEKPVSSPQETPA